MKGHIIPFRQPYSLFDLLFRPKREFKAEWQLDYHGFMTREEFDIRLEDINRHIRHLPLMTEV
ncbi:12955_t:CDS:1, partial [Entrophospora sp. SA101]